MKAVTLIPLTFSSSCLWFLLVLSLCINICFCNQNSDPVLCIPSEQLALIDLKNNLTDPANRLSSWIGKDCCTWSGVVCDNFTGHVHEIHLRGPEDGIHGHCNSIYIVYDGSSSHMLEGTISPTVIKLLQLRYLDLSCNNFGHSSIPEFIGSFTNLIHLNISKSNFSEEIPHQLGNLSTLSVLDVSDDSPNYNLQSKSLKWLKNLKRLQRLDMGGIDLAEASDWFMVISNLTSLIEIHLSSCALNGSYNNSTTGGFKSLDVLDLSYNYFNMLPVWIFSLRNLGSLDLTGCNIIGVNPETHGGFHSMPSLRTLRLSRNTFMNSSLLLNGLSSLSNLRFLDVSQCGISSPILGSLQNLSHIEYLDLSSNRVVEEIPKSFGSICKFTTLNLQSNYFFGNVSELLERFCECESPQLELFDIKDNHLFGQLPERLGKLKNLVYIVVTSNQLTGAIPESIGNLSLLNILDISGNQLSNSIPNTIGGLSSLISMDLSDNRLNGSLPESIGRLSKLTTLYIQNNSLTGIVTENHFSNLTSLKYLWIGDNKLVFKLHVNNWIPPFKLMLLSVGSCSLGPRFPSWIESQTDLITLNIANANISDTIPNWIWTTFSGLRFLNISHNQLQGELQDITLYAPRVALDLSNNYLHGMLPGSFNRLDVAVLDLSNNKLSGSIEPFLCFGIQEPRPLRLLNLANNSLSGVVPDCWMNWRSLLVLNLEKNQFSSIIPSSLGDISFLKSLDMDGNKLYGNLPPWLLNSSSLVIIELAENELTGKIPSSIGRNNTWMRVLSLRSNKFEGKIPNEICHLSYVQILDLAHNNLSGNLPTCFTNFTVISGSETSSPIDLYQTTIPDVSLVTKGNTYKYTTILYQVTSIDLSNNKLFGSIPDELIGLLGLRFLNLSHNGLTGTIPNLFNKTGKLESLDLSMNNLHGNIPLSLSQLTTLSLLNVSYNNLVGRIPTGPQFQTFNEFSFIGNALCGDPLPKCLPNNGNTKGSIEEDDEHGGIDWILVIFTLAGLVIGFWIVIIPLILSKRWRKAYFHFLDKIWFKLQSFFLILYLRFTKTSIPISDIGN